MAEKKNEKTLTPEQQSVVESKSKRLVVSASAGSGKTFVVVEKLIRLICHDKVPVSRLLVLTFTKAAANELKTRLYTEILNQPSSPFLIEQLDDIMVSDISTIDSFCEKVIKRNINKLSLPQNFTILDEKNAKKLKNNAFKRTFEHFSSFYPDKFDEIYFAFKRNSEALEECVNSLQAFFDSASNSEELIESFSSELSSYHEKACKTLKEYIENRFNESKALLDEAMLEADICGETLAKGHVQFIENMQKFLNVDFAQDLFDLCKDISSRKMPSISTAKCSPEIRLYLGEAKEIAKDAENIANQLQFVTDDMIESAKEGRLAKITMQFFIHYAGEYKALKEKRSALDFADLEKYAQILLKDDEVKKSLQERYDYIFIDEYQDTNRLQESILKPIAEGGYFIAVGDIKQGIYGFRNASKEIMSEDIAEFALSDDGEALFLRGNFRTDKRILSFVNDIFVKLMTSDFVGIDYKETSMLEGLNHFEDDGLPPVSVDVVCVENPKSEEEENKNPWDNVYSVKEDSLEESYKYKEEVLAIASRIEEALQTQIYSAKQKAFRRVELGDIALLFRGRSELMQECVTALQERGFPVNADIKENLLEDSQISLIVSLLKLTINSNDDIPLASVMASPFGGFSIEELALLRKNNPDGNFYEVVKNQMFEVGGNKDVRIKIISMFEMIDSFKFDISVHGIVKACERLFIKTGYEDFINSLPDAPLKRLRMNKLFAQIRSGNLDFCPQELISQLENANKEDKGSSDGGNAITITTIHATKGLEYPIVIICGGGENLSKVYNKNYIISKEFGLGSYLYSYEDNLRLPSPAFLAGKLSKKKGEMIDELMLFYVAMTRAQNHLYIIGSGREKDYSFSNLQKQNTYLKQIFFALGENFTSNLFSQEQIQTANVRYSIITKVEEENLEKTEKMPVEDEISQNFNKELEKFYAFEYPNKEICKFSYKNTVTGTTKLQKVESEYNVGEALFSNEENSEEKSVIITEEQQKQREMAVIIGNSYHEALKLVDFDKINTTSDIEKEMQRIKPFMSEGYFENINNNLLFKNIKLIKDVVGNREIYKEREFIMQSSPSEVKGEQVCSSDNEEPTIIVQGIVDLFAVGDKNILIDYKYTSLRNEEKLIERYCSQIRLYSIALEKAFGKKVDEKYLLSLKEGKLIKLD